MATQIIGYDNVLETATLTAANFTELDSYTSANTNGAHGIAISGTVAYVAAYNANAITAIDITDPENLAELDSYTSANLSSVRGIAISGTVAYVVSETADTITAIDITDPENLAELDSYTSANLNGARGITISGTVAYVVSSNINSITAIDITTPASLAELDSYTSANLDGVYSLVINGTVAYVASEVADTITAIDITTPASLAELDSYTSANLEGARGIAISGTVAYVVALNADAITAIDITDPTNLAEINSYTSTNLNGAAQIAISGTDAYITTLSADALTSINIDGAAENYAGENIADWFTWDAWQPANTGTSYVTAALSAAAQVDYFAVFGHDLGETGSTIKLQYSDDNGASWVDLTSALDADDSHVIFETFTAVTKTHYRIVLACPTAVASVAVVAFGARLELPKAAPLNVSPAPYTFGNTYLSSKSDTGRLLGRTLLRKEMEVTIEAKLLDPAWVRAYWLPFIAHAEAKAFFYSWDHDDYPDDAAYCYIDKKADPVKYRDGIWNDVKLKAKAQLEL